MHILLWFLASLILAIIFAYLEILVLIVGINNLHYSLYYCGFGIAGFLCRYMALRIINSTNESILLYKIGGIVVLLILIVGCITLIANIVILIAKKISK
jgi:hypothetical protein